MALIDRKDAKLDFGTFALKDGTAFTHSLDLGATKFDGFGINFAVTTAGAGGTSWTPKIQASTNGSTWVDVVVGAAITTSAVGDGVTLTFPRGTNYRYVRPLCTTSGSFTAGVVSAAVETYKA